MLQNKNLFYLIRLCIYEILTFLIMVLGWLREKLKLRWVILKHRTFFTSMKELEGFGYLFVCCDCGLSHRVFLKKEGEFMQPSRPNGYSYKLRALWKSSPLYEGEVE